MPEYSVIITALLIEQMAKTTKVSNKPVLSFNSAYGGTTFALILDFFLAYLTLEMMIAL